MTSRPMNTTTTLSCGAACNGRMIVNSMAAASTKEIATVTKNATQ